MQVDQKVLLTVLAAVAAIELVACERQQVPTLKSASEAVLWQAAPGVSVHCRCGSIS